MFEVSFFLAYYPCVSCSRKILVDKQNKYRERIKYLITKGREQGYLTYSQVNDYLPEDLSGPDQVEVIIQVLIDMGISVFEQAPDTKDTPSKVSNKEKAPTPEKKIITYPKNYFKNKKNTPDVKDTQSKVSEKKKAPTPAKKMISYPKNFLSKSFEDLRKKLLDISGGRSRLLNLDQTNKKFIRIVDELPDQLAGELLSGKAFTLDPVPDPKTSELIKHGYLIRDEEDKRWIENKAMPTATEWAKIKGIKVEYELPLNSLHTNDDRHQDQNIQTLRYNSSLTTGLKKLASEARTSIEETGNNILFLALGFLEWTDQKSGNKRLAPLYMIPVKIESKSKKGIIRYEIIFTGEDVIANLTLQEKLIRDFEVELPPINDKNKEGHIFTPEEYFSSVEALLKRKKSDASMADWKIRRYATIAPLNLGRLLMYLDLDPARWSADDQNLLEHYFIRQFFSSENQTNSSEFDDTNEPYILDDVELIHEKFPMVEDADSSQMSALIDIMKGNSVVIEGPPGTGKSQTITNIIAAAISQNKSVLFVAEKQAALDVVKRRMDKAGLGDFCLDLHSDKAQKRLVLESFNKRMQSSGQDNFDEDKYDLEIARYERSRKQLQEYCLLINEPWGNTGLSIHEILCAATRYAKDVAPLEYSQVAPEGVTTESFSRVKLDEQLEQLELFFKYLEIANKQLPEAGNWKSHPWYGVKNKDIDVQNPSLKQQLSDWTNQISSVNDQITDVISTYNFSYEKTITTNEAELWVSDFDEVLKFDLDEKCWPVVKNLSNYYTEHNIQDLKQMIQQWGELKTGFQDLKAIFNEDFLTDPKKLEEVEDFACEIQTLGIDKTIQCDEIKTLRRLFENSIELVQSIEYKRNELVKHLPKNKSVSDQSAEIKNLFSISQKGFSNLADFIRIAGEIPTELLKHRDDIFDEEELPKIFKEFKNVQDKLLTKRDSLSQIFNLESLPDQKTIENYRNIIQDTGFFSWLNPEWNDTKRKVKSLMVASDNIHWKEMAKALNKLTSWIAECTKLRNTTKYKTALGDYFDGVDTNGERLALLIGWYQLVRKEYGVGFSKKRVLSQLLFNLEKDIFQALQEMNRGSIHDEIDKLQVNLDRLAKVFTKFSAVKEPTFDFSPEGQPLKSSMVDIDKALTGVQECLVDSISQKELSDSLTALKQINDSSAEIQSNIEQYKISENCFDGQLVLDLQADSNQSDNLSILEQSVNHFADENKYHYKELFSLLTENPNAAVVDDLILRAKNFKDAFHASAESEKIVLKSIGSTIEEWVPENSQQIKMIYHRNKLALTNIDWLDGWLKYLHAKDRMQQGGYGRLKEYLSDSQFSLDYAQKVMCFSTYTCLANEIYSQEPALSQQSGHEQTSLQTMFQKYDEELKKLQRKKIRHLASSRKIDPGTIGAKISSYTGGSLLKHEVGKKTRHVAIRRLVERAGEAMLGYKPCFMMSPMAVTKYLPPGRLEFDLVIMDEASQVKPEYALSCFARGKQAVIVGDPKQLPPTNFFDRNTSNETEDDDSIVVDSESILEAVAPYFPKKLLKWHYRSRHESLINFSNSQFYDDELVVFPSPWEQSDQFGIKFHHIKNGVFAGRINNEEAKFIVTMIKNHFLRHGEESIGIVAMNSTQRDQIDNLLEAERARDGVLDTYLKRDAESQDPLFIKNLENVQGDERDVIIMSFTYGPIQQGSDTVPQRFGPINNQNGWRRLNVLFTRAKNRIHVVSSMRSHHIIDSESSSRGARALKNYLAYAETGKLIKQDVRSEGQPDSDFEIAVIKQLVNAGYECISQVGVANFRIDIGVRDPGNPGRFLMGIECDGATYHSSKSTRDRDRVRQGVLEGLGWTIRRVWSTDWFKNPDAEMKSIIEELGYLTTKIAPEEDIDKTSDESFVADPAPSLEEEVIPASANESLVTRLQNFNENTISKQFPETPSEKKLLRSEMLKMLDEIRPTSQEDFQELVPIYLREHTSIEEASVFLGNVLEIIAVFEEMETT